jgi:hypothetical protein
VSGSSDDVQAVLRSQEFFRLKQTLVSQGDIFELAEGTKAIYIGPDSDVAEVQITYYNPDAPLGLETAIVAVNGPLVGRIDALNATPVPSTGQPARILANANDIVNNNSLVNLLPGADTAPRSLGALTIPASVPAQVRSGVAVVRASDAARIGNFDAGSGEYNESDQPPSPAGVIAGAPRGMADLLLVNIKDASGTMNPGTRFVDVFVKVCDREA